MKKDEPRQHLGGPRGEGGDGAEERMEDWYETGVTEFEEGEVVRGRVVHIGSSEVLVDVGYKSEGAIPIEEFHRHGVLPKVGEEIEVYLEAKAASSRSSRAASPSTSGSRRSCRAPRWTSGR